ncbi:MAG: type II toxin-antitoxin system RelE/ParE family toxin [Bdellovibrionaceae bacterium]|nr:type II toxin-antitoxin system RelE/ParE family toxin [Pseudobdellovibrionaceae bacterium]
MSSKAYEVVFKKSAAKELQSLPQKIQQKILDAVQLLSLNPYTELLQIKKMKGVDSLYRARIQDYRIIYVIENQIIKITIIKVGHRKEVYE